LDLAKSNSRGVTGLRRVLQSLETGGVQTIFLSEGYSRGVRVLALRSSRRASSFRVRRLRKPYPRTRRRLRRHHPFAIRRDIELFYLKENDGLDRAGNIAALLRFRPIRGQGRWPRHHKVSPKKVSKKPEFGSFGECALLHRHASAKCTM